MCTLCMQVGINSSHNPSLHQSLGRGSNSCNSHARAGETPPKSATIDASVEILTRSQSAVYCVWAPFLCVAASVDRMWCTRLNAKKEPLAQNEKIRRLFDTSTPISIAVFQSSWGLGFRVMILGLRLFFFRSEAEKKEYPPGSYSSAF